MDDIPIPLPDKPIRFMDRLRAFMRAKHLAYRTEKTYCGWILDFIRYHQRKHPEAMGATEVDAWLSYLANTRNVSINTQKTALNAVIFLYRQFLNIDIGQIDFTRTNKGRRLPTVFTHDEAMRVLSLMSGSHKLAAYLSMALAYVLWRRFDCALWILILLRSVFLCEKPRVKNGVEHYCQNHYLAH